MIIINRSRILPTAGYTGRPTPMPHDGIGFIQYVEKFEEKPNLYVNML